MIFWLSNDKKRKEEILCDYNDCISEAIKNYNDVSGRAKNKKKIVEFTAREKELEIIMESSSPLGKPSIALQIFSGYLASKTRMGDLVRNKALFRGSSTELVQYDAEKLTDNDMLKKLIDAVLSPTNEYVDMISEVKDIIVKYKKGR